MGERSTPRVSIGLPVYNGEAFLEDSLDSLLHQTFEDFELVIVDNASTDRTGEICRAYAEKDPRVRYRRNDVNIGGFRNHRLAFGLASAPYFMWAADDDVRDPEYLERCVDLLDRHPEAVIACTRICNIDGDGDVLSEGEERPLGQEDDAVDRFRRVIRLEHQLEPVMGLYRASALRRVRLAGEYPDSDRVMLAELSLLGRFVRAPEHLFYRRDHEGRSTREYPSRQERMEWIEPGDGARFRLPHWRQLVELHRGVRASGVSPGQKVRCHGHLARWAIRYRERLAGDVRSLRWRASELIRSRARELGLPGGAA